MDENLTSGVVSADEFGRLAIRRLIHRPGIVSLDRVRGQSDSVNRMVPDKAPLLNHLQRYKSGGSSDRYGSRHLMTYAKPVGNRNINASEHIQQSTTESNIQADIGADIRTSQVSLRSPVQRKINREGQVDIEDISGTARADKVSNTGSTISESIIQRNLFTPMTMHNEGRVERSASIGLDRGHSAVVSSKSLPGSQIQRKNEISGKEINAGKDLFLPKNLGSIIIQRKVDIPVITPVISMSKSNESNISSGLMMTSAPLVQKSGSHSTSPVMRGDEGNSLGTKANAGTSKIQRKALSGVQLVSTPSVKTKSGRISGTVDSVITHPGDEITLKEMGKAAPVVQRAPVLSADDDEASDTSLVQTKAITGGTHVSHLPVVEYRQNNLSSRVAPDNRQTNNSSSLQMAPAVKQDIQINRPLPPVSLTNSSSTGKTLFRKQAGVITLSGDAQYTSNIPGLYENDITMPVMTAINKAADNSLVSRSVDGDAVASSENLPSSNGQDEQAEVGVPLVTDELVEKIFSRLMRRLVVESERRGWVL